MEVWIGRDGERHGPYNEGDIRQWLRSGQVSRDDLGWYEGLADWQSLAILFPEERPVAPPASVPPMLPTPLPQPLPAMASIEDDAGFWKRVGAYLLDTIILYIPGLLIQKMMGGDAAQAALQAAVADAQTSAASDPTALFAAFGQYYSVMVPAIIAITVVTWLYFALCESSAWQATPGKLALGIRVTDMHGARISLPRALARYPAKYLSSLIFGIGFLMVAWTQRKQGLHDLIAGTLVLNGRANEAKGQPKRTDNSTDSFSA
ncbi:RDD family protein [Dyella tabacisoli]|uniref:RDD family protein n=1 Tax=Dyella tabacisoli TaxID=2282381 RepID=A0A369UR57_9GAMM|nr:RDD family protein [Dyella tabacisoli]RDD80799.1 RDD family protein [Dyella tabacisoli]